MQVSIVTFPKTKVASITHLGPWQEEHVTVRKLVEWRIRHGFFDQSRFRSYGLHYTDARTVDPSEHKVDFCLSVEEDVEDNEEGVVERVIPELRCALARDTGSRMNNQAARYLIEEWLPDSGEQFADFPVIFHYVNVGPNIDPKDEITDVYLPLK